MFHVDVQTDAKCAAVAADVMSVFSPCYNPYVLIHSFPLPHFASLFPFTSSFLIMPIK